MQTFVDELGDRACSRRGLAFAHEAVQLAIEKVRRVAPDGVGLATGQTVDVALRNVGFDLVEELRFVVVAREVVTSFGFRLPKCRHSGLELFWQPFKRLGTRNEIVEVLGLERCELGILRPAAPSL